MTEPVDRRFVALALAGGLGLTACGVGMAQGRARPGLYDCEGCEGVYEQPQAPLSWRSRIDTPLDQGEPLTVEGRVLRPDTGAPAAGVALYVYHTNAEGLYANGAPRSEWSRRHGRLRGWIRTGDDGRYRFDTLKPAPYPGERFPAHLHFTVLEPGRRPYYIDDVVFDGEFGVTADYRARQELRGGSGIVPLVRRQGRLTAVRDIRLELHPG